MNLTIRPATADDAGTLRRLAQLDSQNAPAGAALLAEQDGVAVAAIALADGRVVADPFHRTADVVTVLRARAEQVASAPRPARSRRALRLVFSP